MRTASLESSIGTRLGKSSMLGMLIYKPRKGLILSVYVDDINLEHQSDLEDSHERR